MQGKKCPRCKEWKTRDEYYKCSSKASGLQTKCKACQKELRSYWKASPTVQENLRRLNKAYYARRGHETKRAYDASERGRELHKEHAKAYRTRHPEKVAAHNAVLRAIETGSLRRQPCEICGNVRSHAHHDDYSRPLDVMWLCQSHHIQRHKEIETHVV